MQHIRLRLRWQAVSQWVEQDVVQPEEEEGSQFRGVNYSQQEIYSMVKVKFYGGLLK